MQSCLTISHIIKAYPEELTPIFGSIKDILISKLSENIATVRESAAIALVSIC